MKIFKESFYNNVCTDTRKYNGQAYFFAIPGENFNALEHLGSILNDDRLRVITYQKNEVNDSLALNIVDENKNIILNGVNDFFTYFQNCSLEHRKRWGKNKNHKLIAISGSNGKTTNKEIIFHILNGLYPDKVIKTLANNNNHIGVPLTLFDIKEDTQYAVVELGSNAPGEIERLCEISQPDCAVTTNVGYTHMEFFKSLQDVFAEESQPYHYIKDKGFFLINNMDEHLATLEPRKYDLTIGSSGNHFDVNVNFSSVGFTHPFQRIIKNESLTGKHNFINLALSVSICYQLEPERLEEIIVLAENFKPRLNRSEWTTYKEKQVFLDAYNANPSSMIAALEGFKESHPTGKSLVVIGDMNELGEYTKEGHLKVARFLRKCAFEQVVFIGRYAELYLEEYPFAMSFKDYQEFKPQFDQMLESYETVFLKASRTLQLERLIDIK